MAQLVPVQLEDGTEIYIEATEGASVTAPAESELFDEEEEVGRSGQKGWGGGGSRGFSGMPGGDSNGSSVGASAAAAAAQSFKAIEGTIRTYTKHTLSAFKDARSMGGNIDKVTLQFGIRLSGEAGVPYVTKGTAESNLSITVECSFDDKGNPVVAS